METNVTLPFQLTVNLVSILAVQSQLFDRNRLLVDLDEATDPDAPESVLVVVGLRGLGELSAQSGSHPIVNQLRDRFAAIVGGSGAVYRTRSVELCAILDGAMHDLVGVLSSIHEGFTREAARADVRVSTGFVELPREASRAPDALALADRRMTAADGPIRYD
jgi:hypothetical protein